MFKYLALSFLLFASEIAAADVVVTWTAPTNRVSGEAITTADLGGYEIHYRKVADPATVLDTVVLIPDGKAVAFPLIGVFAATYKVSIAAYDTAGRYSDFVPVMYTPLGIPQSPTAVKVSNKAIDLVAACLSAAPNCRVAVVGEWK